MANSYADVVQISHQNPSMCDANLLDAWVNLVPSLLDLVAVRRRSRLHYRLLGKWFRSPSRGVRNGAGWCQMSLG